MKFVSGRCPNCGYDVQLSESKESGFCSSCGSAIRVQDAVQKLKLELSGKVGVDGINTVQQLKVNAQRSFDVGQYQNAISDWRKAADINKTDHESWWGIVRCEMKLRPKYLIENFNKNPAFAYAPNDVRKRYEIEVKKHNDRINTAIKKSDDEKKAKFNFNLKCLGFGLLFGVGMPVAVFVFLDDTTGVAAFDWTLGIFAVIAILVGIKGLIGVLNSD